MRKSKADAQQAGNTIVDPPHDTTPPIATMPRKVNPEAEAEIVLGEGLAGAAPETVMQVRASLPPAPPRFFISGRAKKRMRRLIARANRLRGVAIDARARSRPTRRAFAGGRIALGVAIRRRGRRGSAFMRARAALDPRRLLPRPGVRPFSDHPLLSSGFPFAPLWPPSRRSSRSAPSTPSPPPRPSRVRHVPASRAGRAPPTSRARAPPHTSDRRLSPPDRAESRCELLAPPNLGGIKKNARTAVFSAASKPPRSP